MRLTPRKIVFLLAASAVGGGIAGRVTRLAHEPPKPQPRATLVPAAPSARVAKPLEVAESIYDGRLGVGWQDWGWGRHDLATVGPARVVFGGYAGIVFYHPELKAQFGGVTFRFRAPKAWGQFLAVSLKHAARDDASFHTVDLTQQDLVDLPDGWQEAWIAWPRLNPHYLPIERVVIFAARPVDQEFVELDKVSLTKADAQAHDAPERDAELAVLCDQKAVPIDPLIYGITLSAWGTGATGQRIGGNPVSRLNWDLGATWNLGKDWFFENAAGQGSVWEWVNDGAAHHAQSAVTVPMIGWVAKDTTSVGFPSAKFPQQKEHDPYRPEAGNGIAPDGRKLRPGSPTETSVAAPPDKVGRWVTALKERDAARGARSVAMYILDNEPSLWSETHRDVHPDPVSQDELLERTIAYASAIRASDPKIPVAGPAEWGWSGYFFSGKDHAAGEGLRPDRRAHGDLPVVAWYLKRLAEYEKAKGVRLLDVLDLHFYPQADRVYGPNARTDEQGAALRIRSTRALWDPKYTDESWINEPVRLIPRMHQWVDENYPGIKLSLGEWSFGADEHMSGALATAEALGRFGQQRLDSAFYWDGPKPNSRAFWAFRAFRNFDGAGGHFLDWSVPTKEADQVSLFASRDEGGTRLVAVLLNLDPVFAYRARVTTTTCGAIKSRRAFSYTGDPRGLVQEPVVPLGSSLIELVPPYSIRVVELELAKAP